MSLYRKEWKLYLHSIYLPIVFLAAFGFYQYQFISYGLLPISHIFPAEGLMAIHRTNGNLIYLFAAMIFTGFEMQYRSRQQFPDDLTACGGRVRILLARIELLATLSLIFFCTALPYGLEMMWRVRVTTGAAVVNLLLTDLLSFFLLPLTAGLMGLALGNFSGRIFGYASMAILFLLISPATAQFFWGMGQINSVYQLPKKLFSFFTPNVEWFPVGLYGVAVEKQRWLLLLLWQAVSLGILLPGTVKKKSVKTVMITVCCAAVVFSFYGSIMDPGTLLHRSEDELGTSFNNENELIDTSTEFFSSQTSTFTEPFTVMKIDGSLAVTDRLTADLTVWVDRDLSSYAFTLYRGFSVSAVLDESGAPVPFVQNFNTVVLQPEAPSASFRFLYSGGSSAYFANMQAVYLPGSFAYYPTAGVRYLNTYGAWQPSKGEISFSVAVSAPIPVYSNLAQTDGRFTGVTSALTLYGGICESSSAQGLTVYRSPYSMAGGELHREYLQTEISELCLQAGLEEMMLPDHLTVFLTDGSFPDPQPTYTADCIVDNTGRTYQEMAVRYVLTRLCPDGDSYVKNSMISSYANLFRSDNYIDTTLPDDLLRIYSEEYGGFYPEDFFPVFLARAEEQLGREVLLQALVTYLQEPQDYESTAEFLMDLIDWQEYKEGLQ